MVSPTAKAGAFNVPGRLSDLAKVDGKINDKEKKLLAELQSAFQNIQDPGLKALIGNTAQKMGLAGAQQTARMASGAAGDAAATSAAHSAGGASDPLRSNGFGNGNNAAVNNNNAQSGNYGSALPALGGKGGMMFEDMVAQFLFDVIKEMQAELKKKMAQYKATSKSKGAAGAGGAGAGKGAAGGKGAGAAGGADSDSRQLMFEEIKNLMQKMQQMIQSLSNILNTMHQGAMNSIRNIKV